jgi:hypothetical protein
MSRKKPAAGKSAPDHVAVAGLLASVPRKNEAAQVVPGGQGLVVTVPVNRPKWLVPPLSWVLPFSRIRRVELDAPGRRVLELCDGHRTVEEVIETFAKEHKLSFREGQVAVTQFLRELLGRGIIVLVGM